MSIQASRFNFANQAELQRGVKVNETDMQNVQKVLSNKNSRTFELYLAAKIALENRALSIAAQLAERLKVKQHPSKAINIFYQVYRLLQDKTDLKTISNEIFAIGACNEEALQAYLAATKNYHKFLRIYPHLQNKNAQVLLQQEIDPVRFKIHYVVNQMREMRRENDKERVAVKLKRTENGYPISDVVLTGVPKRSGVIKTVTQETLGKFSVAIASYAGTGKVRGEDYTLDAHIDVKFIDGDKRLYLFGVFDGHGGSNYASSLAVKTPSSLKALLDGKPDSDLEMFNALKLLFPRLDAEWHNMCPSDKSGTTAHLCVIKGSELWAVNVGDSRSILGGSKIKTIALSKDQNATAPELQASIEKRGGVVIQTDTGMARMYGRAEMGRSVGEYSMTTDSENFKVPGFTSRGKIVKIDLNNWEGDYLCLGTDGLWNFVSPKTVMETIKTYTKAELRLIARYVVDVASFKGSGDDITLTIVDLRRYLKSLKPKIVRLQRSVSAS